MNGAELLVDVLKAHDVEHVSMLCGNGQNPFIHACLDADVRIIDVRNEQAAAYMARRRSGQCRAGAHERAHGADERLVGWQADAAPERVQ